MYKKPKIGMKDMCKFLGISSATVRLYERYLRERRYAVADSGHRVFTGSSAMQLYDLRFMSKSGMSIQNAAQACQSASLSERVAAYVDGERDLALRVEYLKAALMEVDRVKGILRALDSNGAEFSLMNVPGFWYLECERAGKFLSDPGEVELINEWTSMVPAVYYINRDVMERPDGSSWSYRMGFGIAEEHAHLVTTNHEAVRYIPAQRCVAGVVVDENSESLTSTDYQYSSKVLGQGLDYIESQHLQLAGQGFCRLLASMLTVRDSVGNTVTGDVWYGMFPVV